MLTTKITTIADKTRKLTGLTNKMTLDEIAANMDLIKTDPILQDKSIEITENGTTNIVADEGYDGLNNVDVTVNVEGKEDLTEELEIYNNELVEQETTLEDIVNALQNKIAGGGDSINTLINLAANDNWYNKGWESGGWNNYYVFEKQDSPDNYRPSSPIKVVGGETLYLSKALVLIYDDSAKTNDTSKNLIVTVPEGATRLGARTFASDFSTFNPDDYIISRTPIE